MIYITGDTHGEQARFSPFGMPREESFKANDTVIVCGDFGYIFRVATRKTNFLTSFPKNRILYASATGTMIIFPQYMLILRKNGTGVVFTG